MAIAKSLDIDEITTQSTIARNDSDGHLERSERSQSYAILRLAPQNDNIFPLAPLGRADLRTDVAKRVRIANRLSGMHVSAKAKLCERGANPRQGVRRTGEGSKVKIAQSLQEDPFCTKSIDFGKRRRVRDDMSILVPDNEIEKPDCHVADAPRNDNNCHPELVSGSQNKTFFSRFTSHFSRKRVAFTLAEVLITLGIIGVVASMTIASVVQNYTEKATVAKVKKFYSIISQAHLQALEEKGTPDNWNLGGFLDIQGAENLINAWAPYLKITKNCGRNEGCYKNVAYKDLSGNSRYNIDNAKPFATAMLADGFLIDTQVLDVSDWDGYGKVYGAVHVDINGKLGPNTYGKDHFRFYVTDKAIVPSGINTTLSYNFYTACLNNVRDLQGTACTAWVLYNENMDYLHCKDLSWTGKTKCKNK